MADFKESLALCLNAVLSTGQKGPGNIGHPMQTDNDNWCTTAQHLGLVILHCIETLQQQYYPLPVVLGGDWSTHDEVSA